MTTRQISIDEDDFQAFVDGQLPPDRCRAVMAYLAAQPEESARMGDYRNLNQELHRQYDEVLYEPLPARLRLLRDGMQVAACEGTSLEHDIDEPGVYRIEAVRASKGRDRTWILSNPIYLR